jgi:hypothetical protein
MRSIQGKVLSLFLIGVLFSPIRLQATKVIKMDLEKMTSNAEKIFRGRVISVREDMLRFAGGELPTVTYRLEVSETFKGTYETVDEKRVVEIRMLGTTEPRTSSVGGYTKRTILPELPKLDTGREYLLFTTRKSSVGLSTTVGLGQGCFQIIADPQGELAVNEAGNRGLLARGKRPQPEPRRYRQLAEHIRRIVAGGK